MSAGRPAPRRMATPKLGSDAGLGGAVAWGSGDWRCLSRDEDALDWSGDAFSAHMGVDAALRSDLRVGLASSWFSIDVDYTDRSQGEAIAGSYESRMTSLTPYLGWACRSGFCPLGARPGAAWRGYWDEGVVPRPTDGGDEARLELGYGLPAFAGHGTATPYAGFGLAQGGERDMRAGVRLGLGAGFDFALQARRGLELRIDARW